jgi:hypothetical protein
MAIYCDYRVATAGQIDIDRCISTSDRVGTQQNG